MAKLRYTARFKRDYLQGVSLGCDPEKLKALLELLRLDAPLPPDNRDGPVKGTSARACRVEPGWILYYRVREGTVTLLRVKYIPGERPTGAPPAGLWFRTLLRSPVKTLCTALLLAVAAFFFVFNLSAFVAQQKTAKEVEEGTFGVLTAENTPPKTQEQPLYGFFPQTDPTNPVTNAGRLTYEDVHQQPFTAEEEEALAALPYISAVDRRYMTAGVSEDYLRLYDYPQYFGCQDRVILEGTVAAVEKDEFWTGILSDMYSGGYDREGIRDVWLTDVKLLSGDRDYLELQQEVFDGRARVLIAAFNDNYEGRRVHTQPTIGRMDLRYLVTSRDYEVSLKDVESIVPGRRYVFVLREDPTVDPDDEDYLLYAMGDDFRKDWWPYITDVTDLPENYLEEADYADLRSLIEATEADRHTFDVVYTSNMASIRRITTEELAPVQGRFLTPEDAGKPVCVVSEAFLKATGLHLGDSVDLKLGNVLVEQYAAMGAVAMTRARYATEWTPASFTIVGSYEDVKDGKWLTRDLYWAYSDSTVFVPSSFLPAGCDTENHLFRPGEISFVVGEAKNIPAFEKEGLLLVEELGLSYRFEDRNWTAVAENMSVVKTASLVRLLAFTAAALLAAALTVYLFLVRRKKEYAILRALGCPRNAAAATLTLPLLFLAAFSVLVGTAAARLRAGQTGRDPLNALSLGLSKLPQMSAPGYALAFLGFLCLIGLLAYLYLGKLGKKSPLALLQEGKK